MVGTAVQVGTISEVGEEVGDHKGATVAVAVNWADPEVGQAITGVRVVPAEGLAIPTAGVGEA
jgi:hypothetical protein